MKNGIMKHEIIVIYAKQNFSMTKKIKANIKYIIKFEIIATTPENLEVLLTIFAF